MRCPHCQAEVDVKFHTFALGQDADGSWQVATTRCPVCDRIVARLVTDSGRTYPAWPPGSLRPFLSPDVPEPWRGEYHVSCQVLVHSEEAAAALARRLLGRLLQKQLGIEGDNLFELIGKATALPSLPSYLKEALGVYVQVARLSTESSKSIYPDRLSPVEPGEAEWTLDVIESFLEFEFVARAKLQRKIAALREQMGNDPTSHETQEGLDS